MKVFKFGLWSFKVVFDCVEWDFNKDNGFWSGVVLYVELSSFGEKCDLKDKVMIGVFEYN